MAGLETFGKKMREHAKAVEKNADILVRKCALTIDTVVVLATPVDTGRARGNWQVTLNVPPPAIVEDFPKGSKGSSAGPAAREAIANAQEAIASYKKGDTLIITNNLPYIAKLNEGSSAQAPAGFVQTAIQRGIDAVRRAGGIVSGGPGYAD